MQALFELMVSDRGSIRTIAKRAIVLLVSMPNLAQLPHHKAVA